MNDKSFLKYAITQSFRQPLVTGKDIKTARSGSSSDFVFYYSGTSKLHPAYFSLTEFQKISNIAKRCILRSQQLSTEYQTFKHYLSENIHVPTNGEEERKLQTSLQLSSLSRSAAQKKKVLSAIIDGDFAYKFSQLIPSFTQIINQFSQMEKKYSAATECCQLSEFAAAYRQSLQGFRFTNIMFWLNKKRFLSYLCEAIQILRFQPKLPDDYLETRKFIGENLLVTSAMALKCRNRLQYLLAILETMAQKDDLLQHTQLLLANPRNYRQFIMKYRNHREPSELAKITALRQNAKKLFKQYAFLTYLDGVRLAFEYKMDETPVPRQPILPTVAPQEEIKKIRRLVSESVKTTAVGRLSKIYNDALRQFTQTLKEMHESIN